MSGGEKRLSINHRLKRARQAFNPIPKVIFVASPPRACERCSKMTSGQPPKDRPLGGTSVAELQEPHRSPCMTTGANPKRHRWPPNHSVAAQPGSAHDPDRKHPSRHTDSELMSAWLCPPPNHHRATRWEQNARPCLLKKALAASVNLNTWDA
jgi:hypothetical protein